jgi:hypothetical protein
VKPFPGIRISPAHTPKQIVPRPGIPHPASSVHPVFSEQQALRSAHVTAHAQTPFQMAYRKALKRHGDHTKALMDALSVTQTAPTTGDAVQPVDTQG